MAQCTKQGGDRPIRKMRVEKNAPVAVFANSFAPVTANSFAEKHN